MQRLKNVEKVDILKYIHAFQMNELMFRREREFRIFTWSATIFIGLIAVLLVVDQSTFPIWNSYGIVGKIVASTAVILLGFYSISWQNRERRLGHRSQRVVAKINSVFHCFDNGYFESGKNDSLLPIDWMDWGTADILSLRRFFRANLITATWILCFLDLLMIWLT